MIAWDDGVQGGKFSSGISGMGFDCSIGFPNRGFPNRGLTMKK